MRHPGENNLALLAGGESGTVRRFFLDRHVRNCEDCQEKVAEFQDLRKHLAETDLPDVNWNFLSKEMGANIRLGLEAGACVRTARAPRTRLSEIRNPRFAIAFASLLLVAGASFFLTDTRMQTPLAGESATPVLQPTVSGIEYRRGTDSFAFLDRQGVRTDQTVNAQGAIEARYINDDTGSVTINNVYLQQP
jgi:hypothetical protein